MSLRKPLPPEWYNAREARHLARGIAAYRQFVSLFEAADDVEPAVVRRLDVINGLPVAFFKGRSLRTVKCPDCGRERNYWPSQLWQMIDPTRVICAWCLTHG